jgi:hypothetical protein
LSGEKTASPDVPDGEGRAMLYPEFGALGQADKAGVANEFTEVFRKVFLFEHSAAEFRQSGVLNLAYPFAGNVEGISHFFQSFLFGIVIEAEAKAEDLEFAF